MTGLDKFIYILICILTFGIYALIINRRTNSDNREFKITVDLNSLINNLGGDDNIAGNEYTLTKVKIYIKDKNKVDIDAIRSSASISGVVMSSKFVTIIVGKQAKFISKKI